MKQSGKCPKCGGREIIADAVAVDRGHYDTQRDLSLATYGKPNALIFRDKRETSISAWVCAQCGYVEFYADAPGKISLPHS